MTRLDLFKSASDFAIENIKQQDPVQLDILGAQAFQEAKFDAKDYNLWKQYATGCRNQYVALATQPLPSAASQPAAAQPAPQPRTV